MVDKPIAGNALATLLNGQEHVDILIGPEMFWKNPMRSSGNTIALATHLGGHGW